MTEIENLLNSTSLEDRVLALNIIKEDFTKYFIYSTTNDGGQKIYHYPNIINNGDHIAVVIFDNCYYNIFKNSIIAYSNHYFLKYWTSKIIYDFRNIETLKEY